MLSLMEVEEQREQSEQRKHAQPASGSKGKRVLREIIEIAIVIVVAAIITLLVRTFVINQYEIPTGSMEPPIVLPRSRAEPNALTPRISTSTPITLPNSNASPIRHSPSQRVPHRGLTHTRTRKYGNSTILDSHKPQGRTCEARVTQGC